MDIGSPRRAITDEQLKLPDVQLEVPRIKCSLCCAIRTSIYLAGGVACFAFPFNILSLSENAPYFGYNVTRATDSFNMKRILGSALRGGLGWGPNQTGIRSRVDKESAAEQKFRRRHLGMLAPEYSSAAPIERSNVMEHGKVIQYDAPKVVNRVMPAAKATAASQFARQQELAKFAKAEGMKTIPAALVYKQRSKDFLQQGRYFRYIANTCDRFMYQAVPVAAVCFTHQLLLGEFLWSKSERPLYEVNTISTLLNVVGWLGIIAGSTYMYRRVLPRYNPALKLAVAEMMRAKRTKSNLPYLVGSLRESIGVVEMVWATTFYTATFLIITGVTEFIIGSQYAMGFTERGDTSAANDAVTAERACGDSPRGAAREAPIGCFQKWVMNPVAWYYADWSLLCSPRWREWREVQLLRNKTQGAPSQAALDEAHAETIGYRGRLYKRTRIV